MERKRRTSESNNEQLPTRHSMRPSSPCSTKTTLLVTNLAQKSAYTNTTMHTCWWYSKTLQNDSPPVWAGLASASPSNYNRFVLRGAGDQLTVVPKGRLVRIALLKYHF